MKGETLTEQTVELKDTDPLTGLPELPEGLFWRVGDFNRHYASGGWSSGFGDFLPGLGIMKMKDVKKSKKVPIFGTRWYNKTIVVNHETVTWTEQEAVPVYARLFTGHTAYSKDDIPDIGVECGSMSMHGKTTQWHYEIPVNHEGTSWLALKMRYEYLEQKEQSDKWEEAERAKKTMRESIYGDYPPKTLAKS